MVWEKIDRTVNREGTTITYRLKGTEILVQSRKRQIPHSNRGGFWWHTTYFVIDHGEEIAEKQSLTDAKKYAEAARAAQMEMGVV